MLEMELNIMIKNSIQILSVKPLGYSKKIP